MLPLFYEPIHIGISLREPTLASLIVSPQKLPSSHETKRIFLQGVSKKLVHLGDLGGDGEIDCPVANFHNETSNDLRVDLVGDL